MAEEVIPQRHAGRRSTDYIPELCQQIHDDLDSRLEKLEENKELNNRVSKLETSVERLKDRLPNWAVLVISGLSAFTGFAINHIFFHM